MKKIGVDIKIANADSTKFFGEWLPNGNFDIANFAWVGSPFSISGSQAIYRDRQRQQLRPVLQQEGRRAVHAGHRRVRPEAKATELGNQIDQQITADMATIPLYQKPTFIAWRNTFANISDNSTQDGPFWNAEHLGAEDRLEPWRTGKCSGRGPVGDRRPASSSRHDL